MVGDSDKKRIEKIKECLKKHEMACSSAYRKKISRILSKVDDGKILEYIGMAKMPLIAYLLSVKYQCNPMITPIYDGKDLMLSFGDYNFANMSYLAVCLHFMTFEKGILSIEGFTSYPSVVPVEGVCININHSRVAVELSDVGQDRGIGKNIYEKRQAFKYSVFLEDDTIIFFENRVGDNYVPYGRINVMRFMPVSDLIEEQYFYKDGWIFYIEKNCIVCKKSNEEERKKRELSYQKELKKKYPAKVDWAIKLRDYYFDYQSKKKHRTIWLFMDRPDRADDNAKVLFKYVQAKEDIDSYFLLNADSHDITEMSNIGKVVEIYSEKHYQLALTADFIISSQCNGLIENPFWNDAEFFRDLYHRPKIIFLQHGTIKDDMSPTLNRYNTNFTGFITGTKAEYQSILEYPYHYTKKEVWLTGQPRFDELYDAREKLILIMPSWRKSLMEQEWDVESHDMKWRTKSDFKNSDFYKHYRLLLMDKKLQRVCKERGYRMLLCLHPLMRQYTDKLTFGTICEPADSETSYGELFAKASILITDYSSVAFDFSFLKKPVIYYQFDKKDFFKEHTYRQGYFDYKRDGFGPVCYTGRDAVNALVRQMDSYNDLKNDCSAKSECLWPYSGDFCKRVYEKIMCLEV